MAHHREPVVRTGRAGFTASVYREIDNGLSAHELVKIKLAAEHRAARTDMITAILAGTGALLVQRIGHIAVFYRRHPQKPKIILP
ncbi:MAG: YhbY family RNA-binding protein [Gammaproteobacteria bacterium]|nr:YhbY family RNA-binding protein [Gammaproteobacteria bacterium]